MTNVHVEGLLDAIAEDDRATFTELARSSEPIVLRQRLSLALKAAARLGTSIGEADTVRFVLETLAQKDAAETDPSEMIRGGLRAPRERVLYTTEGSAS